jgi:DNA-binding HxlR family transcriptional regulator
VVLLVVLSGNRIHHREPVKPAQGGTFMSATHTAVTPVVEPCGQPDHPDCGIREVLNRLCDKWSVLVIVELASGVRRFRELERAIFGISQRMLTLTLRRLERDGLIIRTVYPTVPAQVTYELTDRGRGVTLLVKQLAGWSLANRDAIAESRRIYDRDNPGTDIR